MTRAERIEELKAPASAYCRYFLPLAQIHYTQAGPEMICHVVNTIYRKMMSAPMDERPQLFVRVNSAALEFCLIVPR